MIDSPHRQTAIGRRYYVALVSLVVATVFYFMIERGVLERIEFTREKEHSTAATAVGQVHPPVITPPPPRIFDILLINDEFDGLELRMKELHHLVDIFFIIESPFTFSNKKKPLKFKEVQQEERFKPYRHKIIHLVLTPPTLEQIQDLGLRPRDEGWTLETYSRNAGWDLAIDTYRPSEGDWIIVSDIDEIPRRSILQTIKDQNPKTSSYFNEGVPGTLGDLVRLECPLYYYSFEYRSPNPWYGPVLTRFREKGSPVSAVPREKRPGKFVDLHSPHVGSLLRNSRVNFEAPLIPNACFHCSWCFKDMATVLNKLASYSHTDHNTAPVRDAAWIIDHFQRGKDFIGRDEHFDYIPDNNDVPETLKQEREAYKYMLLRRNQTNAGFWDMDRNVPLKPKNEPPAPDLATTTTAITTTKSMLIDTPNEKAPYKDGEVVPADADQGEGREPVKDDAPLKDPIMEAPTDKEVGEIDGVDRSTDAGIDDLESE